MNEKKEKKRKNRSLTKRPTLSTNDKKVKTRNLVSFLWALLSKQERLNLTKKEISRYPLYDLM